MSAIKVNYLRRLMEHIPGAFRLEPSGAKKLTISTPTGVHVGMIDTEQGVIVWEGEDLDEDPTSAQS